MMKQTLTQAELDAMVIAMDESDFGPEIELEIVDEDDFYAEDDGQPSEYEEWQDYFGGDVEEYGTYGADPNGEFYDE